MKKIILIIIQYILAILILLIRIFLPSKTGKIYAYQKKIFDSEFGRILLENSYIKSGNRSESKVINPSLKVNFTLELKYELDLTDAIQRSFYLYGYPEYLKNMIYFSNAETLFFDIGANIGLISFAMSNFINVDSIYAFEPIKSTFEKLVKMTSQNNIPVNFFNVALMDKTQEYEFCIPTIDSGAASFDRKYLLDRLKMNKYRMDTFSEYVAGITFDDFILKNNLNIEKGKSLIKIDTEGAELLVLKGMVNFLERNKKPIMMIIEVHSKNYDDVMNFMRTQKFNIVSDIELINNNYKSCSAQDIIFTR